MSGSTLGQCRTPLNDRVGPLSARPARPNYSKGPVIQGLPLDRLQAVGSSAGPMAGWSSASRHRAGTQHAEAKRNKTHITMGWGRVAKQGNVDSGLQTSAFSERGANRSADRYEVAKTNVQQGWGSSAAAGSMGGTTTSAYGAAAAPTPLPTPPTTPHYNPMSGNRMVTPRPSAVAGFDGYVHAARDRRLGRTAGAAAGTGRTTGNIGARTHLLPFLRRSAPRAAGVPRVYVLRLRWHACPQVET